MRVKSEPCVYLRERLADKLKSKETRSEVGMCLMC